MEPSCDNTFSSNRLGATDPAENARCSLEPWSKRYLQALARYEALELYSSDAFQAVAEELSKWAALLPLRSVRPDGRPAPANKWGLGAERCLIRGLISHLVERGDDALAARVTSEMIDLMETVVSLDEYCMSEVEDPEATARLVGTARIQVKSLAQLLKRIASRKPRTSGKASRNPRRKPQPPSTAEKDRRLMEQWDQMKGRGGMSRTEFCSLKGITLRGFIRAQDRHRKRLVAES